MQENKLGLCCDILLKVWKEGDTYCGMYLEEDGFFVTDEDSNMYDKARGKLAEYGAIENLEPYGIEGITAKEGVVPLENSYEGVVLSDAFLFAVPHLDEPYILIAGNMNPEKIIMHKE